MALTTSLVALSSVLLARLLGLASGVVSILLTPQGAGGVWSKTLSPLVLSPLVLNCCEKVGQPG